MPTFHSNENFGTVLVPVFDIALQSTGLAILAHLANGRSITQHLRPSKAHYT